MKKRAKLFSVLLAMMMILQMMPITALANAVPTEQTFPDYDYLTSMPETVPTDWIPGAGTEANPYIVDSFAELKEMMEAAGYNSSREIHILIEDDIIETRVDLRNGGARGGAIWYAGQVHLTVNADVYLFQSTDRPATAMFEASYGSSLTVEGSGNFIVRPQQNIQNRFAMFHVLNGSMEVNSGNFAVLGSAYGGGTTNWDTSMFEVESTSSLAVNGGHFYVDGYKKTAQNASSHSALIVYGPTASVTVNGGVFVERNETEMFVRERFNTDGTNRVSVTNATFVSDNEGNVRGNTLFHKTYNHYTHANFEESTGYLQITTPFVAGESYQWQYVDENSVGDTGGEGGFTAFTRSASTLQQVVDLVDSLDVGERLDLKLEGAEIPPRGGAPRYYSDDDYTKVVTVKEGTKVVLDLNGAQVRDVRFVIEEGAELDIVDTAGDAFVIYDDTPARYIYKTWQTSIYAGKTGWISRMSGTNPDSFFNVRGKLNIHGGTFRTSLVETSEHSETNETFAAVVTVRGKGEFTQSGGTLQGETKEVAQHRTAGIVIYLSSDSSDHPKVNLLGGNIEAFGDSRMVGVLLRTADKSKTYTNFLLHLQDTKIETTSYTLAFGHNFKPTEWTDVIHTHYDTYISGETTYEYINLNSMQPQIANGISVSTDPRSTFTFVGQTGLLVESTEAPEPPPPPVPVAEVPTFITQPQTASYDLTDPGVTLDSIANLKAMAQINKEHDPEADITYQWFIKAPFDENYRPIYSDPARGSGETTTLDINTGWFTQSGETISGSYAFYCVATNTRVAADNSQMLKSSNIAYIHLANRHDTPEIEFVPNSPFSGLIRVQGADLGETFGYSVNDGREMTAQLDSGYSFEITDLSANDDISVWRPTGGGKDRSFSASHFVEQADWPSGMPTFVVDDTDPDVYNGSITVTGANKIRTTSNGEYVWDDIPASGHTVSNLGYYEGIVVSYQEPHENKLFAPYVIERVGQHKYDTEEEGLYTTFTTLRIAANASTINEYILKEETDTTFPTLPPGLRWDASERTLYMSGYDSNSIHLGDVGKVHISGLNTITAYANYQFSGLTNRAFSYGVSPDAVSVDGGKNVIITGSAQTGENLTIAYESGERNMPSMDIAGDLSIIDANVSLTSNDVQPSSGYTMIDVDGDLTLSGETNLYADSGVYGDNTALNYEEPHIVADIGGNLNLANSGDARFSIDYGNATERDHSVVVSGDIIVSGTGEYEFFTTNQIDMMEINGEVIFKDPSDYDVSTIEELHMYQDDLRYVKTTYTRKADALIVDPTSITPIDGLVDTVYRDRTHPLSASVLPLDAPQGVTWSVSGNRHEGTYVTMRYGEVELRVDRDETAPSLTVTATSTANPDIELVRHYNVAQVTEDLTGSVTIAGSPNMGALLTIASENVTSEGTLSYNWFVSEKPSGSPRYYIVGEWGATHRIDNHAGRYVGLEIKSTHENGGVTSNIIGPITKGAGPEAPSGLEGVPPTSQTGSNGYILGTTWDMEWKTASGTTYRWTDGNTINNLLPGTYHVRYKETRTNAASAYTEVTVPGYAPITYTGISVTRVGDDTPIGSTLTVAAGSSVNLEVKITGTGAFGRGAAWTLINQSNSETKVEPYNDGKKATLQIAPIERTTLLLTVSNEGGQKAIITVKVAGEENNISSVYQPDFIEGEGTVAPVVSYSGGQNGGDVTFMYKGGDLHEDADTYVSNVPTKAGNYTVRATSAESGTVVAASVESTFSIDKPTSPLGDGVIDLTIDANDLSAKEIDLSPYIPSGLTSFEYEGRTVTYIISGAVTDTDDIIEQSTYQADGTTPTFADNDTTPTFNLSSGIVAQNPPQQAELRFNISTADYENIVVQVNVTLNSGKVGDVNGSGRVDAADLTVIADPANYNRRREDATNKSADVNGDGKVNFLDLAIARNSKNFGK